DAETTESGRGRQERGRWRGDHGDARQRHDELAAATDALAPGLHAPAVLGDQALDERQADPEAGRRAILRDGELDEDVEDRPMRASSRRSSSRRARCWVGRAMTARVRTASPCRTPIRSRILTPFRTTPSGLRSSWASMARNSSLAWLADSAVRRASSATLYWRALSIAIAAWAASPPSSRSCRSVNRPGAAWPRTRPPSTSLER